VGRAWLLYLAELTGCSDVLVPVEHIACQQSGFVEHLMCEVESFVESQYWSQSQVDWEICYDR
jgi:hypothetical protein